MHVRYSLLYNVIRLNVNVNKMLIYNEGSNDCTFFGEIELKKYIFSGNTDLDFIFCVTMHQVPY